MYGQGLSGNFGVLGESESGVGIVGKGGRLAGFFDGNVEVTGSLTVQGINISGIVGRLQTVEELVKDVQNKLDTLQSIVDKLKELMP